MHRPVIALILLTACGETTGDPKTTDSGLNVCDDYLACLAEVDPGTFGELVGTYGGSGTCWDDEATAASCLTVCEDALQQLLLEHPEEPACGGTPAEEAQWPFEEGDWDIDYQAFTTAECGSYDEETIATLNEAAQMAFSLSYAVYPEFRLHIGTIAVDCTVDADDFTCLQTIGDAWMRHSGTFATPTTAAGEMTMDDGEGCSIGVSFEMAKP